MLRAKICIARKKSPWLVVLIFIPVIDLIFLPCLAFSDCGLSGSPLPARLVEKAVRPKRCPLSGSRVRAVGTADTSTCLRGSS